MGETYTMFEARKKKHNAEIRLTKKDLEKGKIESAEIRMGKEGGGIARHSTKCSQGINWKNRKRTKTKKSQGGNRTRKIKVQGKNPLNSYDHP